MQHNSSEDRQHLCSPQHTYSRLLRPCSEYTSRYHRIMQLRRFQGLWRSVKMLSDMTADLLLHITARGELLRTTEDLLLHIVAHGALLRTTEGMLVRITTDVPLRTTAGTLL